MQLVELKPCGEGVVASEGFPVVADSRFEPEAVEALVLDFVVVARRTGWCGSEAAALLSPAFAGQVGEPRFYREIGAGLDVVLESAEMA